MARFFINERCGGEPLNEAPSRAPIDFHRRIPGYRPTPLVFLDALAKDLGIGALMVKDESSRFGLPAFKILGGSWATLRACEQALGGRLEPWSSFEDLVRQISVLRPRTLVTATDGNHGRGVARTAKLFGFAAKVFVPQATARARIDAIANEGARVSVVEGSYDDAVAVAANSLDERSWLLQDTTSAGHEEIPHWVIEGYATILWEIEEELARASAAGPDLVLVQIGVGALAGAVIAHYRQRGLPRDKRPVRIVGVEPESAACALEALAVDRVVSLSGPHTSIMAGLNCGTLASIVWPTVRAGLDATLALDDARAEVAMRSLAAHGVVSGESGAAGLAGLLELLKGPDSALARTALGLDSRTRVLVISTEGITDPIAYRRIVG